MLQLGKIINYAKNYTDDVVRLVKQTDSQPVTCVIDSLPISPKLAGNLATDCFQRSDVLSFLRSGGSAKKLVKFSHEGSLNYSQLSDDFINSCDEMAMAIDDLNDRSFAKRISSSGDLFSYAEICNMKDCMKLEMTADDIIRCRGDYALYGILKDEVKLLSLDKIKHYIEEYVNKLQVFKKNDSASNFEYTKIINKFIKSSNDTIGVDTLYRGEQSRFQIKRLLKLLAEKNKHPDKLVKYTPDHLFSTTDDLSVLTDKYEYADKCFIKIIGVKGKCKGIDVNKLLDTKNKFFNQKEILLPSTCEFEVVEGHIENGRLMVTLRFISN